MIMFNSTNKMLDDIIHDKEEIDNDVSEINNIDEFKNK